MKKDERSFKAIFKRALYSISFLLISSLYPLTNVYTGRERLLITPIDEAIPFNKYFIIMYVFWYIYLLLFIGYFCIYNKYSYYKVLLGINLGMLICYVIYLVYPTTVPRLNIDYENGFIGFLFKWLYSRDNPYNCFPSIHVLDIMIIVPYVIKEIGMNKYIKIFCYITSILIIYSTFAIKQHVILDAVSATIVALALYAIFEIVSKKIINNKSIK